MSYIAPTDVSEFSLVKGQGRQLKTAHFLGVCGAGMMPIAHALLHEGVKVSGSDIDLTKGKDLISKGATLHEGHHEDNLNPVDAIVYSTAIPMNNPEILKGEQLGIPLLHRSEMLGLFLQTKESILVAGTHGKTTTTAMLTLLLEAAGFDPWSFVGGKVDEFNGNLRVGTSQYAVAEADESDGSFLKLPRNHAIITNIEPEHLNYWKTEELMYQGFEEFISSLNGSSKLVVCVDDPGIKKLQGRAKGAFIPYSLEDDQCCFYGEIIQESGTGTKLAIYQSGNFLGEVELAVPGRHNASNATGAIALALSLGAEFKKITHSLNTFQGVRRRFTKSQSEAGFLIVDDYAHHPTEIEATVKSARLLARERGGELYAVLQPHRYTRTAEFFHDFAPSLHGVDHLIVTDVYAAGEKEIPDINGKSLSMEISKVNIDSEFISDFKNIKKSIYKRIKKDDIVLLLGAGSVTNLSDLLSRS